MAKLYISQDGRKYQVEKEIFDAINQDRKAIRYRNAQRSQSIGIAQPFATDLPFGIWVAEGNFASGYFNFNRHWNFCLDGSQFLSLLSFLLNRLENLLSHY